MNFVLQIMRQKSRAVKGAFGRYEVGGLTPEASLKARSGSGIDHD